MKGMNRMSRKNAGNLHFVHIILQNLKHKAGRTLLLSVFLLFLTFTIFSFSSVLYSMKQGLDNTVERAGADILLVPREYISSVKDALFLGIPSTVYFDSSLVEKAADEKGVAQVSAQLFLATIYNSPCCDEAVQIIAYHPESDFLVQPWIEKELKEDIPDGEIVVGSKLSYKKGDTATFFGKKFHVAGKLEETGMGYDSTVFLNFHTANQLLDEPVVKNYLSLGDKKNVVSLITIRTDKNVDVDKVAAALQNKLEKDNVSVETSGELMENTKNTVKQYSDYFFIIGGMLFGFTFLSLISIFTITLNERKKEYGIVRSLGGSSLQILFLTIGEAVAIGFIGSTSGSFLAVLLLTLFRNLIILHLKLPFFRQSILGMLLLSGFCLMLSVFTGVAASLVSTVVIRKKEAYTLIKENE